MRVGGNLALGSQQCHQSWNCSEIQISDNICIYGNSFQGTGIYCIHTLFQSLEQQETSWSLLRRSSSRWESRGLQQSVVPGSAMRTGQGVILESGHRPCWQGQGWLSAGREARAETKGRVNGLSLGGGQGGG